MIITQTSRLVLRLFSPSDAGFVLRLLNDPSYHANIGDKGVRTLGQAQDYIVDVLLASHLEKGIGLYLVEVPADGARAAHAIGFAGLVDREGLEGIDLGYAFLPEHWGQGYALEAARAVIDFARDQVGLDALSAIVAKENTPSARLLRRLGFCKKGDFCYPETGETLDLFHRML